MSSFSLDLNNEDVAVDGSLVAAGSIQIGGFKEVFHASLSYWDRSNYHSQWKEALDRLVRGETCSAIVTSMYDPRASSFLFWWVMYLIDNVVHIQNHVLFFDALEEPFDESNLYKFVPARETHNEDGERISEWVIGISEIQKCSEAMHRMQ